MDWLRWAPLGAVILHIFEEFAYWLTIAALTCANGCWHAWASFKSREYSPGAITGVAIYIPLGVYGYNHFLRSGAASMTTALIAAIVGGSYHFWSVLFHRGPNNSVGGQRF
jgi:hypothetical protein